MTKYRIILGIEIHIETEKQIDALKNALNSLPETVQDVRVDKIHAVVDQENEVE